MVVEKFVRGDLEVVAVSNDQLSLAFLPQVGGRLISLEVEGSEMLWRNPAWLRGDLSPVTPHADWPPTDGTMGSWANVGGSKTWPAPQGWDGPLEWAGPPDPVLDAGAYAVEVSESADGASVTLTSKDDPRTGLAICRHFVVPPSGREFSHTSTLTNTGAHRVRWSAWEVTQVDTGLGGEVVVDVLGPDDPRALLVAQGEPAWSVSPGRCRVPVQPVVAKLGFPTASGRLDFRRADGAGLVQEFHVTPGAVYPDGGCPVELWLQHPLPGPLHDLGELHPDADLVELETLSPLVDLGPGESASHHVTWRCRGPRSGDSTGA